ncbi:hypothetical protein LCGC14_2598930 [marine sediment metagenome]|uniref:Uncharacterized protein n=1 Tax=marine sediment metagenome TaxID=412755 RepID=A0A0F9A9D1_9ZZZZ
MAEHKHTSETIDGVIYLTCGCWNLNPRPTAPSADDNMRAAHTRLSRVIGTGGWFRPGRNGELHGTSEGIDDG